MPTISKEKIPFAAASGETIFVREIKITSYGTFSIELPPDVVLALNTQTVYGQTMAEVKVAFNEALANYRKRKATKKKIIAYKVTLDGEIERDGKPALSRWGPYHDHYSKIEGIGLAMQVGLFWEIEVERPNDNRKGLTTEYRYEEIEGSFPKSVRVTDLANRGDRETRHWDGQMDWTAEREAFWLRVATGLERLILDLAQNFSDRKTINKLADGKAPFLALR